MSARKTPQGDFRKILESVSHRHDTRRVFDGFTRLSACALAVQTREAEYLEEAKQWEKGDLDSFAAALKGVPTFYEPHVVFKKRVPHAIGLIRTSDTVRYANLVLESG